MSEEDDDFILFQEEFTKWQYRFGLTEYKVYFKYEDIGDYFANITVNQADVVATVRLNSDLAEKHRPFRNIQEDAKHEALHLLVYKLEYLACSRYVSSEEIEEAVESLVHKLEGLVSMPLIHPPLTCDIVETEGIRCKEVLQDAAIQVQV